MRRTGLIWAWTGYKARMSLSDKLSTALPEATGESPHLPLVSTGVTPYGPFEIRWTEFGPADAALVLLLHGIYAGAHSYEWRKLVPELATTHRVRVPDLLGTGRSDRPAFNYNPDLLASIVQTTIVDAGESVHVVASSLTGAYALRTIASGTQVRTLTLITPSGLGHKTEQEREKRGHRLYDIVRSTPLGNLIVRALTSSPSVTWFQKHRTYRDPELLTAEEVFETRRAGRLPGAKYLQLAFVFGRLSIGLDVNDVAAIHPTVIWGAGQRFVANTEAAVWATSGASIIPLSSGLPHVEEPQRVAELIRAQITRETRR